MTASGAPMSGQGDAGPRRGAAGTVVAIKVDVDTERGTRIGVPSLLQLFDRFGIRATFLFSLGPDNTGRAIRRVFRPGFLNKVGRTDVVGAYGLRTLLNGVLWPGPHIGRKHARIMLETRERGHEVGIHCFDHVRWQDGLARMSEPEAKAEFRKALDEFERIFQTAPQTAGAAGWQANAFSLAANDDAGLLYASDTRGEHPFLPASGGSVFRTPQIPTTLPTLDELLGREEFPMEKLVDHYLGLFRDDAPNVLTIHAELEGMAHRTLFRQLIEAIMRRDIALGPLGDIFIDLSKGNHNIPVCEVVQGTVDGRSGTLAVQGRRRSDF